jgi:hypothetical protein
VEREPAGLAVVYDERGPNAALLAVLVVVHVLAGLVIQNLPERLLRLSTRGGWSARPHQKTALAKVLCRPPMIFGDEHGHLRETRHKN